MNRHERRRAKRMARENKFVDEYVSHLPQVPVDAPLERGRLYHTVMHHDAWCKIYDGDGGIESCNCNPLITRYIEPRRS